MISFFLRRQDILESALLRLFGIKVKLDCLLELAKFLHRLFVDENIHLVFEFLLELKLDLTLVDMSLHTLELLDLAIPQDPIVELAPNRMDQTIDLANCLWQTKEVGSQLNFTHL
jgi:hypothetical protein